MLAVDSNYCGEFDNFGSVMSVSEDLLCAFELLKVRTFLRANRGRAGSADTSLCSPSTLRSSSASSPRPDEGSRRARQTRLLRRERGRPVDLLMPSVDPRKATDALHHYAFSYPRCTELFFIPFQSDVALLGRPTEFFSPSARPGPWTLVPARLMSAGRKQSDCIAVTSSFSMPVAPQYLLRQTCCTSLLRSDLKVGVTKRDHAKACRNSASYHNVDVTE